MGNRTQLTYPGSGLYVTYDYLITGEMKSIWQNGTDLLATFGYDNLGRRSSLTRGNGTVTSYSVDPVSRLASITQDLTGTASDLTIGSMTYDPASQIVSQVRSNDTYAWTNHYNLNRPFTANGLNQYTLSGTIVPTYDGRGNLTAAGTTAYAYDGVNRLVSAGATSLSYDPLLCLTQIATGAVTTRCGYDGTNIIPNMTGRMRSAPIRPWPGNRRAAGTI